MVKVFLYVLLALILGGGLAALFAKDPGYLLLSFQGVSMETSLAFLLLCLVLLGVVLWLLLWLLRHLNPLVLFKRDTWHLLSAGEKAAKKSTQGVRRLAAGDWHEAYEMLLGAADKVEYPLSNYLGAALAAFQLGDKTSWLYCLERAEHSDASAKDAVSRLKALFFLRSACLEESLALLVEQRRKAPKNPYVLMLLKEAYVALKDWQHLKEIFPELEKNRSLDEKELMALMQHIILDDLQKAACGGDDEKEVVKAISRIWNKVPKALKTSEALVQSYAQTLLGYQQNLAAMTVLIVFLRQHWSDALVKMLGTVSLNDPREALLFLEQCLKDRPNNAIVLLSLGRLSLQNKLWGKAREYFEAGLALASEDKLASEFTMELGRLLGYLGDEEKSMEYFRQAAALMERSLPDLPMPKGGA